MDIHYEMNLNGELQLEDFVRDFASDEIWRAYQEFARDAWIYQAEMDADNNGGCAVVKLRSSWSRDCVPHTTRLGYDCFDEVPNE